MTVVLLVAATVGGMMAVQHVAGMKVAPQALPAMRALRNRGTRDGMRREGEGVGRVRQWSAT